MGRKYILKIIENLKQNGVAIPYYIIKRAEKLFEEGREGTHEVNDVGLLAYAAACLFIELRNEECRPLSHREFLEKADLTDDSRPDYCITLKRYRRAYRKIVWRTNERPRRCNINPKMFVKKYCNTLKVPKRVMGFALRLTKLCEKKFLYLGRDPSVFAAAIIYISCTIANHRISPSQRISQKIIAELANTSEVAIRNNYKAILEKTFDYIKDFWCKYNKSVPKEEIYYRSFPFD